jgi:hypothetical protein
MRSFLGWTESAGGGSLFAEGWVPEVAGCCAFARLPQQIRTRSIGVHNANERKRLRRQPPLFVATHLSYAKSMNAACPRNYISFMFAIARKS